MRVSLGLGVGVTLDGLSAPLLFRGGGSELGVKTEGVVECVGISVAEGDDAGELVDLALGNHGGVVAGLVAGWETTHALDGTGEGIGDTLDLPARLADEAAPLSFGLSVGGRSGLRVGGGRGHSGEDDKREGELHLEKGLERGM